MPATWPSASMPRHFRARWEQLRRGEYDPEALRTVPAWGLSLLLHSLAILILALLIRWSHRAPVAPPIEGQLVNTQLGDVTSLVDAKQAGDPFTVAQSADPPSIGLDPDPHLKLAGQPEMPNLVHYAPVLAAPTPLLDLKNPSMVGARFPEIAMSLKAPFSGRQGMNRARLVRREGGTAQSEKSVEDGLDWIVRHQRLDGGWSLDYHEQCQGTPCPSRPVMATDTGATGLALLPLLGAGYIHTVKSKHQDAVRRGLGWLVDHQQPDGNLFTGPPGMAYMYSHAIGTMALCEAYGLSQDPRLKKPARLAIEFITNAQDPSTGGWRYFPGQAGDTSVFGWMMFALRSGRGAGIPIPRRVLKDCSKYLDLAAIDRSRVGYAYQPGRPGSMIMTAEALLARQILGWARKTPALVKGASIIARDLDTNHDRNIYYWYYATQLLHNMKNQDWDDWNLKVREGLITMQIKDGTCANGSWDPDFPAQDVWGQRAGRLFTTSLSILTLEVYYRYLPLYRNYDEDQENDDPLLRAERGKN